ncbi:MAG: pyruvate kinase [Candidatus Cloacimonetes bacterium]|jgi:pyruvate kinase|nr:pyruvate kinase [Candidatus Cloacimonadota bacterium]MBT7469470.1 pyruvate kinase [Candidatus Cloacimonadota bacterium]
MKKTKIIATISDLKCDVEFLQKLHQNGMNIVRLNTAHQSFDGSQKIIENVRKISTRIPIIIDTKGPEIRTNGGENIIVKQDEIINLSGNKQKKSNAKCIFVNYTDLTKNIPLNSQILIDDGDIALKVIDKNLNSLKCKVLNDGIIKKHKSINIPSIALNLPSLTEKDKNYVKFAIENNVDFIAHSFVRNKQDVLELKKIITENNSKIKIIAKIENEEGVQNIDEILEVADGIMIARGDLAIEMTQEKIPVIQKKIIRLCKKAQKPSIVATQMLHSMILNPRPTRAEVSDIANAIYDGTDAVMLSGETSCGSYPVESVQLMSSIANEVEVDSNKHFQKQNENRMAFLSYSAVLAAETLSCKAIIADTTSGKTISALSSHKCNHTIFAMCYDKVVMRQVALFYGVRAFYIEKCETNEDFKKECLDILLENNYLAKDDDVVIVAGSYGPAHGASFVEISKVSQLIQRENRK